MERDHDAVIPDQSCRSPDFEEAKGRPAMKGRGCLIELGRLRFTLVPVDAVVVAALQKHATAE